MTRLRQGSGAAMEHLARYRVFLGFIFAAIALWLASPTQYSLLFGGAVMLLGESVRVWAAGHLEKSREVTRSGPYRFIRHPLYLGSALIGGGLCVAARHIVVTVVVVLYLIFTLTAAMRSEEAHLREKFGDAYDAYAEKRSAPMQRSFSWRRAMNNREYNAIAGLAAALAVMAAKLYF